MIAHVLLSLYLLFFLIVLCRMFSQHVFLERIGSGAHVVAVVTSKGLLTSVRSHVAF